MKLTNYIKILFAAAVLTTASCASKKSVVDGTTTTIEKKNGTGSASDKAQSSAVANLTFMQKVSDNQVYAKNIVGNMTFNLQAGDKDITVPGSVHMRKDQVIRLQLFIPILGTEVGRLEFTPSYVLILDRMHKEYIKADYTQVDFLKQNGITFYSLQSLFWNQLFLPGQQKVSESALKQFAPDLDTSGQTVPVTLNNGNMTYVWSTDRTTGRIGETNVSYKSSAHGQSTLNWRYSDFKSVGVKQFPAQQVFSFSTTATKQAQTATVSIKMSEVKTSDSWDAETTISDKYKRVEATDVLKKLMQF